MGGWLVSRQSLAVRARISLLEAQRSLRSRFCAYKKADALASAL
ncbi:hypothetical protein VIS19158_09437 [Vibrio scophthalmi LMG 19158]|uniref:Uncharacterized protein n=1 Tax=Vibrio scophthalmi LMG 19158 TaxID=870967 RepID=F9RJL0_9VIBR|nr:hypothetical protein VIS19158_09437 [Vibrio scophthalmi LMG 19158]